MGEVADIVTMSELGDGTACGPQGPADYRCWARNKVVLAAFPQLQATNAEKPSQEQLVLVLTNRGWQVGR